MEIVYYPNLYLTSERLLKQLLLLWGTVKTIVPPSEKEYVDAYLSGQITHETHFPLEHYKRIYDMAGEKIIDFLVIENGERSRASEKMLDLLTKWNADTGFYDSLKINSFDDLKGKTFEWYWFLHEKLERPLVELMLHEHLVVSLSPAEIVGFQEVGKSYMSVIATEVQRARNVRLITDDEYYLAAKGPATALARDSVAAADGGYELVSLAIPQVFFDQDFLDRLTWKEVLAIRRELLPFAESYYGEIERYHQDINSLAAANRSGEAFAVFCEFCERVAASFRPLAKEFGRIVRIVTPETFGLISGLMLPAMQFASTSPDLRKVCDVLAIASTIGKYTVSGLQRKVGFEYLENLGRALKIARMRNTVTSLIPRTLRAKLDV